jgi:two-component system cell cycle response regulator
MPKSKSKILIIEPSRLQKEIILNHVVLAELYADVYTQEQEGINAAKANAYELVICANELSSMKGAELAQRLRKEVGSAVPILLLSASDEEPLFQQAFSHGVTEIIHRKNLIELQAYLSRIKEGELNTDAGTGRILCVEDSAPIAQLIKKVLEDEGHFVDVVDSAEEALIKLKLDFSQFDLVITDILLAGKKTGMGLIRDLRCLPSKLAKIPILAMSGLDNEDQKIETLRLGASDFAAKPINFEEMVVRARNLVKSKKLYDKVIEQEAALKKLAVTDALTGLYNRHYLADMGLKRVEEARRHQQQLSILMIDIDHFKKVNDTYGHAAGDAILKAVGDLLKASCRREDFAVRFGGEEFVLVLPHCNIGNAFVKAEKLRTAIEQLNPEKISITGSFGVSSFMAIEPAQSFNELFKLADEALYLAKQNGRNQTVQSESNVKSESNS